MLDVGSGLGRFAFPLSTVLPESASYDGFDVAKAYVNWCNKELGLGDNFSFQHVELRNSQYNPTGRSNTRWFRFPWPRNHFSHVVACSLYTHLTHPEINRYLKQTARVLRAEGLFFGTFFLIDQGSQDLVASGNTYPVFNHRVKHGYLADEQSPGDGVAVDRSWLEHRIAAAGMEVVEIFEGAWRSHGPGYYQDAVVARKR